MPIKLLEQLGLSPNEAKIYEALLDLKEAGVGDISVKAEIHRRNVYDAINRLVNKGLIFPIINKKENLYSPVDPDKLLELVKEKEISLKKVLPDLRERYKTREGLQEAYIYRGIEGFKNYMRDVLRIGQDVYFIGAKLGWFDPKLKNFTEQFLKEVERKKITLHHIFDAEVKEKGQDALKNLQTDYRFLPPEHATNAAVEIFGDYVVTFTGLSFKQVDDDVALFVLHDEKLAEGYRSWFKFMFNSLKKPE